MRPPPPKKRNLAEVIELIVWVLFLVWTAVGAFVMPFGIGPNWLRDHLPPGAILDLALYIESIADAAWMTLAAVCAYLALVRAEGLGAARRIAITVVTGSALVEFIGATTGFPFGVYTYTGEFGPRVLGVLPVTIPLAWLVILAGARHLLLLIPAFPWNRWTHAAAIGALALLTDINLEQIAWKVRGYWIWYTGRIELPLPEWPPLQNFVTWFILAFALAATFPAPRGGLPETGSSQRLALILILINALFLLTHAVGWLGWRW